MDKKSSWFTFKHIRLLIPLAKEKKSYCIFEKIYWIFVKQKNSFSFTERKLDNKHPNGDENIYYCCIVTIDFKNYRNNKNFKYILHEL